MAKTKHGVVTISEDIDMDGMLAKIPVDMRNKAGAEAVKAATRVVAKAYRARLPKGKTGNLKRSVTTILKRYRDGTVWFGAAGARHPTGNHVHLIELGHDVYRRGKKGDSNKGRKQKPKSGTARVEGKRDLIAAIDTTRQQQDAAVIAALVKSIKKAGG